MSTTPISGKKLNLILQKSLLHTQTVLLQGFPPIPLKSRPPPSQPYPCHGGLNENNWLEPPNPLGNNMELMLANASGRPGQRDGQFCSHSAPQSRVATMDFSRLSVADALRPQIWKRIAFVPRNKTYATTTLSKTAPRDKSFRILLDISCHT